MEVETVESIHHRFINLSETVLIDSYKLKKV